MSLPDWAKAGWLRPHRTTRDQIASQLALVDRDLKDSGHDLSPDWQFNIAYNAALQLCSILLNVEGWRPERNLAHYRTLQSLPLILGSDWQNARRLSRHVPKQAKQNRIRRDWTSD